MHTGISHLVAIYFTFVGIAVGLAIIGFTLWDATKWVMSIDPVWRQPAIMLVVVNITGGMFIALIIYRAGFVAMFAASVICGMIWWVMGGSHDHK